MATTATTSSEQTTGHDGEDGQAAFIERVAAKYEAEDAKQARAEDGLAEDDAEESATEGDDAIGDDSTAEHTDEDTPADDPDGGAAESGEDSEDDEGEEHTEEESEDSTTEEDADDTADDAEKDEDDEDEEEEPATDATKAALAARGADLKLEDVPEEFRGIIEKKLKSVDAAFTRVQQEAAAFRSERVKLMAEERFRAENPELALVEAIQQALEKDPDIFEKINARNEKLEDADQAAAFKIVLKDKRAAAVQAVEEQRSKVDAQYQRAEHVETTAKALATAAGVPWHRAERAVEVALLRKPEATRDITDDELRQVIAQEAQAHKRETRDTTRTASKDVVKQRTASRQAAPPTTGKRPGSAASPRPAAKKGPAVDFGSEESRQRALLASARRIIPGAKD